MKEILTVYAQMGFDGISLEEETSMAEYIEEHQEECPVELYRGLMTNDTSVEVGDSVEFTHLFESFDEEYDKAEEFALRRGRGIVYVLDSPIGLPLYMHADTCHDETEWVILDDEYVVQEIVEKEENLTVVKIVRKEQ